MGQGTARFRKQQWFGIRLLGALVAYITAAFCIVTRVLTRRTLPILKKKKENPFIYNTFRLI
jgi:hypothetical protein